MRRLFFFLRGESGQSGDSISVCCHKMAGQLFASLAAIKWICSTPLKVNDFTAFCDHACSKRESNDSPGCQDPSWTGSGGVSWSDSFAPVIHRRQTGGFAPPGFSTFQSRQRVGV